MELLRQHGTMTIDDLARELELTRTAVRGQLTILMTKGFVEQRDLRKGPSKPARTFGVTAEAEQQISRAYIPVLTHLLKRLSQRMSPPDFDQLMREVGSSLGPRAPTGGSLRERVEQANSLLHDLGGLTTVSEEPDRFRILAQGCPLGAVTVDFPEACSIVTNLLAEVVGEPVTSCCEQYGRKRCCFEVTKGAA